MIVIGITGSIGMGKTTAANMLREASIPVHDSDAVVRWLLGPKGKAVAEVAKSFPETLKTNDAGDPYIDREVLGRSVFADRSRKKVLEGILHPMVREDSDRFKAEMQKRGHRIVALDIPLLFEIGEEKRVDVTVCISAPYEMQRERVLARKGMTSEKFDRIVGGQLPDAEKRKRANYVVESDKGFDAMRQQLTQIVSTLLAERGQA
jgi:dephospho-CoA kinase